MTTHWMSPIVRSNPRVMEGKAIFTDVSSCAVAEPSPIMATCHPFEWSRPVDTLMGSRWVVEGTLSHRSESDRAVGIDIAYQPPDRGQHVQMRKRLAEGLARIGIQHPREHFLRHRKRAGFSCHDGGDVVEPGQMVFAQLSEPVMKPAK